MTAPLACSGEHAAPAIRRRATDGLLDAIGCGCVLLLRHVSWRAALRLGCVLGRIAGAFPGRRRARAIANLARAGSRDPYHAGRRIRCHAGQTLMEIAWSMTRSSEEVRPHLVVEGLDLLRSAAATGRGVLLVSAHMGNWEMVGQAAALAGAPVAAIARPMRTPRLERLLIAFRERCGVRTLVRQKAGTSLAVARWLQRGGVFACLVDRASSGRRIELPFLGAMTRLPLGPFDLACRLGSIVVVGSARRLPQGMTRVTFRQVTGGSAIDAHETARQVLQTLEQELGPEPERWLWIGRRQPFGNGAPCADPPRPLERRPVPGSPDPRLRPRHLSPPDPPSGPERSPLPPRPARPRPADAPQSAPAHRHP